MNLQKAIPAPTEGSAQYCSETSAANRLASPSVEDQPMSHSSPKRMERQLECSLSFLAFQIPTEICDKKCIGRRRRVVQPCYPMHCKHRQAKTTCQTQHSTTA